MGGKYEIRYGIDDYGIDDEFTPYQSEYTNSFIKFINTLLRHRKTLIYFTVRFWTNLEIYSELLKY